MVDVAHTSDFVQFTLSKATWMDNVSIDTNSTELETKFKFIDMGLSGEGVIVDVSFTLMNTSWNDVGGIALVQSSYFTRHDKRGGNAVGNGVSQVAPATSPDALLTAVLKTEVLNDTTVGYSWSHPQVITVTTKPDAEYAYNYAIDGLNDASYVAQTGGSDGPLTAQSILLARTMASAGAALPITATVGLIQISNEHLTNAVNHFLSPLSVAANTSIEAAKEALGGLDGLRSDDTVVSFAPTVIINGCAAINVSKTLSINILFI